MKTIAVAFGLLLSLAVLSQSSYAQNGGAEVSRPVHHDTMTRPLRDIPDRAQERPARGGRDFEPGRPFPLDTGRPVNDTALQTIYGPSSASVDPKAGTYGTPVDMTNRVAPPDTTGDIGPNHYVQWVNLRYAVYDIVRDGSNSIAAFNLRAGFPKNGNTIFQNFAGGRCASDNDGDPLVQYDQASDRWILTQFAVSASPYYQCVAVSTSGDPTGTYNRYAYSFGTDVNDFPKMGIWGDTYVITYNLFRRGRTFNGTAVCGYERAKMLTGESARQICVKTNSYASILPADVEGTATIPAGSAVPLLSITSSSLISMRLTVNWSTGTGSLSTGTTVPGVAAFSRACGGGTCIPQPGTSQQLDSLGDRLNYRLSYRQIGGHESMVVNHAVTAGTVTGIRWYELRNPSSGTLSNSTPVVFQQGTYAPNDGAYRWMGSAAMDNSGNIAIGYNVSSSSVVPNIRYAFRSASDPVGTLGSETSIFGGGGVQTGNQLARWGDYSTLSVDPKGGCNMVFTTEYIPSNGSYNWSTYIHSFRLSTCTDAQ